jgi:predicted metal-dependent hydrolase
VPRPMHSPAANQSCRQAWLSTQLAVPVTIVWTNNRSVMFSLKGHALNGYCLRLHYMFLQAPNTVWQALVAYVRNTQSTARETLRTYIRRHQHLIHSPPQRLQRLPTLKPRGHYFDLEAIYRELNRTYFANRIQARITWSRRPLKRSRTSIRFGSYHVRDRVIRIHQLLDQSFVPQYVVENVVFHEMLHELIPSQRVKGRWCIHPPEFRRHEQRFQYHWEAEQWKRCHLSRLLRG